MSFKVFMSYCVCWGLISWILVFFSTLLVLDGPTYPSVIATSAIVMSLFSWKMCMCVARLSAELRAAKPDDRREEE